MVSNPCGEGIDGEDIGGGGEYGIEDGGNRQPKQPKQELDLRYLSTPLCECKIKADMRVVESDRKPSKGKLYYCCPKNMCDFFSELPKSEENGEDVEEVIATVSGILRVVGSGTGDVNGNYVNRSWVVDCLDLVTLIPQWTGLKLIHQTIFLAKHHF
ncbi:hypothetical protein BUALT_Bualt07G0093800 [Buddleja alternifolia]|uniref:Uncharacterized protein n=1 Tax=Buddleja alternifolia TaxID=168488 RepID=A0AAV6XH74_9LAMI|nr:hypothetical protein BUALT_Bualt07G0093800 [Buddleja alternifolia]